MSNENSANPSVASKDEPPFPQRAQTALQSAVQQHPISALAGAMALGGVLIAGVMALAHPIHHDTLKDTLNHFVETASKGRGEVVAVKGVFHGMTAAEIGSSQKRDGKTVLAWFTPDHQAMIIGAMTDLSGRDINQKYRSPGSVTPDTPSAEAPSTPRTQAPAGALVTPLPPYLSGITRTYGDGKKHLTIFFDPSCLYCHAIWVTLHQLPKSELDGMSIQWVPVAVIRAQSLQQGAHILSDGYAALAHNENTFDEKTEFGGAPTTGAASKALQSVTDNTALWANWSKLNNRSLATPMLVWNSRSAHGQQVVVGAPDGADTARLIKDIANAP